MTPEISGEHFDLRQYVKHRSGCPYKKNENKAMKGTKWSSETPRYDFNHKDDMKVGKRVATSNRENMDPKKHELMCILPSKNKQRKNELRV